MTARHTREHKEHPHEPKWKIITAFIIIYIVWGSTYLAIKYGIESWPPFILAGTRFLIAGGSLYAYLRWKGEHRPSKTSWIHQTIIGAMMLIGGNGLVCFGEQKVPSGIAALIVASVPLWMALISRCLGWSKHLHWRAWIGILIGFLGIYFLIDPNTLSGIGSKEFFLYNILIVIASIFWSSGSLYSRRKPSSSPLMSSAQQMFGAGLLYPIVIFFSGDWRGFHLTNITLTGWLSWIYLIIMGSLVGYTAYIYLLKHCAPAHVSTYAYVNPVVALLIGWQFGQETITTRVLIGAFAVICAVPLVLTAKPSKKAVAQPIAE
jgi:drug/metabolite transporter (DMT)-like permease